MEFDSTYSRLLLELGFVAVNSEQSDAGLTIAEALVTIRPEHELPHVIAMLALAGQGKLTEAIDRGTKEALPKNPESEITKFFLGTIYHQLGDKPEETKKYLQPLSESCSDKGMKDIATNILKELDEKK